MTAGRGSFRRRLDNLGLRIQARVDADWADRVVPGAASVALFLLLVAASSATLRQLDGGSGLGVWRQAAWQVREGGGGPISLTGTDPVVDTWSFAAYPVLWATALVPAPVLFTVVQAAALAVAIIPLWQLCRTEVGLRIGATTALMAAYGLAPVVHAANLSVFRPEVAAVPALLWAIVAWRRRRWVTLAVAVAVVLACRADLGLAVAGLGALMVSEGGRRPGLVTAAVGLAWTAAAVLAVRPTLPDGPVSAAEVAGAQGVAPLATLRSLVTDPVEVLGDVVSSSSTEVVVAVLGPLLFLPLVAARYLAPALPTLVLGVAGSQGLARLSEPGVSPVGRPGEQVVAALPFVFLAAVMALGRIGRPRRDRISVDHRVVAALVLGSVLFFVDTAPSSPHQRPWEWGARDLVDLARQDAAAAIPVDVAVTTSPLVTELVAERRVVGQLPVGPPPRAATRGYAAVILDTTGRTDQELPLWTDEAVEEELATLREQGFRVRYRAEGVVALLRSSS